ncbi:MAG TPA: HAD-IB family phosphatase [Methylomirabilota bacterium]|jgi:2,3-diketo-5-methylthio-1-phosphopentane phosphatase|nr:HAD-IB family phosphatase [Methylomirabilota bacterium]
MGWVFLLDFDGTTTPTDVGPFILAHFTGDRWLAPDQAWERGELTTPERATRQWAMIDADEAAVGALVDRVALDPHFPALVEACRRRDVPLGILSDGFDFYIQRMLANHGVGGVPVLANHARWNGGRWRLEFPRPDPPGEPAGAWKAAVVRGFQAAGARVAYAGDGLSDRAAAEAADRRFAKAKLAEHCRRHGIPFRPFASLADVHADFAGALELPGMEEVR